MRLLVIILFVISGSTHANTVVDEFFKNPNAQNLDSYKPSAEALSTAKQGYESRAELGEPEKEAVNEISQTINSREFQEQQSKFRTQISTALGADIWKSESDTKEEQGNHIPYSQKPIVFISSSMPMITLRNYAADLEKVNGIMVMRGFIGGMKMVKPTLKFMTDILKVDQHCTQEPCKQRNVPILIDPILFKEYTVTKVPAFTVHGLTNLQKYCKGTSGLNPSSNLVYGDSSVKYLAQKLYQETGLPEHKALSEGFNL